MNEWVVRCNNCKCTVLKRWIQAVVLTIVTPSGGLWIDPESFVGQIDSIDWECVSCGSHDIEVKE